ncbi:MAG: GAF domain-containing sensor histidine kinase [Acidimicrobiales bacterium]|nr:GAF domain-containing sensor histidine kinase [Acidimicrobiales bacterium]
MDPAEGATDDPRLHRLLEAVLAVAADLSLPVVLRRIVESACSLVDARYGALGVTGPDGHLTEFITVGADYDTVEAIGHPPKGRGILGMVMTHPEPLRLRNLGEHPDSYGFPPHHPPMRSFLGVPVRVRGEVFGNLYLTEKRSAVQFTAGDQELVVALAAAAGVAIENARLHSMVRELAVLEDRERIARDLHDTVIQRLFASGMGLQAAERLAERPEVVARIRQAIDDLDVTIRDIRSTIFALESGDRRGGGLRADVLALVAESGPAVGREPRVRFAGPVDAAVPDGIADHLVSTLREALTNVAKHAGASEVAVEVEVGDDVVLRVEDDGVGIDPLRSGRGWGLRNMADRARALGGGLVLTEAPNGGTVLEWRVPLDPGDRPSVANP